MTHAGGGGRPRSGNCEVPATGSLACERRDLNPHGVSSTGT
jgi:hypothetical protein